VTASDDDIRRRFADLEEALLPQVHAADPVAVQLRGRRLRIRRALVVGAAAMLLVAVFAVVKGASLIDYGGVVEPISHAPPPTPTPPSTLPPATTATTKAPTSTTEAPTSTTEAPTSTTQALRGFRFSVAPRTARPGQPVTLSGSGCAAGSHVNFSWVPADVTPASVGELPPTTARSDGTYQTTWRLEPGFRPVRIAITASCAQPKASATAILTISR
jgi:hypothetical protein